MGVRTTAPWDGMLFAFDDATSVAFYMKDTLIPLDIAFMTADGKVLGVETMTPCPPTVESCPLYYSPQPYTMALEVEAGRAGRYGIAVGSHVAPAGSC